MGGASPLDLVYTGADCVGGSSSDVLACATTNQGPVPSPWDYTPKANIGPAGTFQKNSFYEGGIDITQLIPDAGCLESFLGETRSSTPFDSTLSDFALGDFDLCKIDVTKTPSATDVCAQDASVTYTYVVSNPGAVALDVTVTDDKLGSLTNDFKAANGNSTILASGASATFTETTTLTATTTNTVTATGSVAGASVSDTATATVNVHACTISLTKTPNKTDVCDGANTSVTYTYVVKNTGDFFNASGTLVDDNGTPGDTSDDVAIGSWGPLAPGADTGTTLTKAFTVNGTRTNIATASGTSGGKSVSATADATVTGHTCSIAVTKSCTDASGTNPINFSGTITNTGNTPLTGVTLVDDKAGPVTLSKTTLAVGESINYTGSYVPTSSPSTDTVTASGTAWGVTVTAQASATCKVTKGDTFPTETTCGTFNAGTATPLNQINYSVSGNKISQSVNPGVFFYWSKFTSGGGSLTVVQGASQPAYLFKVASWAKLYDSNCNFIRDLTLNAAGTGVQDTIGAGTFIVGVKYDSKSVVGLTKPNPATVTYTFETKVNDVVVDQAAPPNLTLVKTP
ncbi:MAG: hypothetical protein M1401_11130 [Chloroflexi bacterium]|nr:hypothetical protein [Chloroflexota bacterium]